MEFEILPNMLSTGFRVFDMIFGKIEILAIEVEFVETKNSVSYGHFRFWVGGQEVGNFQEVISFNASKKSLSRFLKMDDQRFDKDLDNSSKEEIFKALFDSIVATIPEGATVTEYLKERGGDSRDFSYLEKMGFQERFHLDEVGQEAFRDKVNLLLLKRSDSFERLIWRDLKTMVVMEKVLPPGFFVQTANEFLSWQK